MDLVDSIKGIDKIIALKKKYRDSGKAIYMRLDSGDLLAQAIYAMRKLGENGMLDPVRDKIIIADISDVSQIRAIETMVSVQCNIDPKQFILYGLGGLLVAKNKLRDAVSAAFKLTETEDGPTGKLSNSPGKEVTPGELNIEIRDGQRVIVQESEEVQGERLLKPIYRNGEMLFSETSDIKAIDQARARVSESRAWAEYEMKKSEATLQVQQEVYDRFQAMGI